jgi:hypothetical protein
LKTLVLLGSVFQTVVYKNSSDAVLIGDAKMKRPVHQPTSYFCPKQWQKALLLILLLTFSPFVVVQSATNLSDITIPKEYADVNERNVEPNCLKSIIVIGERHDLIQVQKNIVGVLTYVTTHYPQYNTIGLEGLAAGQEIQSSLSGLPQTVDGLTQQDIVDIKSELAESMLNSGEISAVEYIALLNDKIKIYGVENKELFETNKHQALETSTQKTSEDFQNMVSALREKMEKGLSEKLTGDQKAQFEAKQQQVNQELIDYLQKNDPNGMGKFYKLISDLQKGYISENTFMDSFDKLCRQYNVSFNRDNPTEGTLEKTLIELTTKIQGDVGRRLTKEQLHQVAGIQNRLEEYLEQIDPEIRQFNQWLNKYGDQTCITQSLESLKYLADKSASFAVPFPSSLRSHIPFYQTALQRDSAIADNLLKGLGDRNDAILVVGAAHICGLTEIFTKNRICFLVATPKDMSGYSEEQEAAYQYNLQGKPLPFSLFTLWPKYELKPPPRTQNPNYKDYQKLLYASLLIRDLKAKGFSNQHVFDSIGRFVQGDHYALNSAETICAVGDVYIPCLIENKSGILRLTMYQIDTAKPPTSPILSHGIIGKSFYQFIDYQNFSDPMPRVINGNNEKNIATIAASNTTIVPLLLKGKDSQDRWLLYDGRQDRQLRDEELAAFVEPYRRRIVCITNSYPIITSSEDGTGSAREAQVDELCRAFAGLGVRAFVTSNPALIKERSENLEASIKLPITLVNALPPDGFEQTRANLSAFGSSVTPFDRFSESPPGNTVVIVGHNTEAFLNRIDDLARKQVFANKTVVLIVCGQTGFMDKGQQLRFLRTVDMLNKQGASLVISFDTLIQDIDGLRNAAEKITNNPAESVSPEVLFEKIIKERNIENLKNNFRRDVFLIPKPLYRFASERYSDAA